MRIRRIIARGVRGHHIDERVEPVHLFIGRNGAGKTSRLEAVREALHGSARSDVAADGTTAHVTVEWDDGTTLFRQIQPRHRCSVTPPAESADDPQSTAAGVASWVSRRIGDAPEVLDFLRMSAAKREEELLSLATDLPEGLTTESVRASLGCIVGAVELRAGRVPGADAGAGQWTAWLPRATTVARSERTEAGRRVRAIREEMAELATADDDSRVAGTVIEARAALDAEAAELARCSGEVDAIRRVGGGVDEARRRLEMAQARWAAATERHGQAYVRHAECVDAMGEVQALAEAAGPQVHAARCATTAYENAVRAVDAATRAEVTCPACGHSWGADNADLVREAMWAAGAAYNEAADTAQDATATVGRSALRMAEAMGIDPLDEPEMTRWCETGGPPRRVTDARDRMAAEVDAAERAVQAATAAVRDMREAIEGLSGAADLPLAEAQLAAATARHAAAQDAHEQAQRVAVRAERRAGLAGRMADAVQAQDDASAAVRALEQVRSDLADAVTGPVINDASRLCRAVFGVDLAIDQARAGIVPVIARGDDLVPPSRWGDSEVIVCGLALHLARMRAQRQPSVIGLVNNVDRLDGEHLRRLLLELAEDAECGLVDSVLLAGVCSGDGLGPALSRGVGVTEVSDD